MTLGDTLTLVGLAVAVLFYALQRAWERRRDLEAALAVLVAVRDGMGRAAEQDGPTGWADVFFKSVWEGDALNNRAQQDYDAVMSGSYNQVFEVEVPSSPLEALIVGPGAGDLVKRETIEAANHALYQIGVFNQLVRQQTDFWGRHLAEIADPVLPSNRREAIARAARAQSKMLHGSGIGAAGADGGWYSRLTGAIDKNIGELRTRQARAWWRRPSSYLALAFVIGTVALASWQGLDDDEEHPQLPAPTTTTTG